MRLPENIERFVKNRKPNVAAGTDIDKRVLDDSFAAMEEAMRAKSAAAQPNIWRIIMKTKITKLAAAAVIIIAVLIGINHFGGSIDGASVAWGKVAEKTALLPAFVSREKRVMTCDDKEIPFLRSDVVGYYSPKHGLREDMYNEDGVLLHQVYSLWLEKKTITIQPALKRYKVVGLDNAKLEQYRTTLKRLAQPIKSGEYTKLGRKKIDGVEVEGIEINNPNIMDGTGYPVKFDSLVIRLWAEVETSLIYRLEAEATTSDKYITQFTDGKPVEIKSITKDFQWDVELNKSIFKPNIPDDYTLLER